MLIATAGHVDHGKTLLVHALTGVDTDRLPEEKARGLTIDLGFAYRPIEDGGRVLEFVDVPGHERFIRNMLAGVAAVDHALLVVAADDGPMPQTQEHLHILHLLGVARGAVAVTKIDAVEPQRVAAVGEQVSELLGLTALAGSPVFPVSSVTGEGIEALESHLVETARDLEARRSAGHFRLAVDRRFSVPGSGVVVTGTVFAGRVEPGDRLRLLPSGQELRLRAIQTGHEKASTARAGQRCALNVVGSGVNIGAVARGDWIVAEAVRDVSARLDARIRVLRSESRSLTHWTPVHVHLGARFCPGRVAILGRDRIEPGTSGWGQLVLDSVTHAIAGDRFILRDQSARRTLGGGEIVDPFGLHRGRGRPDRLAALESLAHPEPERALGGLLEASASGVALSAFASARNLTAAEAQSLYQHLAMVTIEGRAGPVGLSRERWEGLRSALGKSLSEWHAEHPDQVGIDEAGLCRRVSSLAPPEVAGPALRELIDEGGVLRDGTSLRRPDHQAKLSGQEARIWEAIRGELRADVLKPPVVTELAARVKLNKPILDAFLARAVGRRQLVRVVPNRFFHPAAVARLAHIAEELGGESEDGRFDAKTYRDRSGIGRNLTIEVLEYFDTAKVTRRIGDQRIVVGKWGSR